MSKELIRAAGGIVHKDGNIFFTNQDMLDAYVETTVRPTKPPHGWVLIPNEPATPTPDYAECARQATLATGSPSQYPSGWLNIFIREINRWCQQTRQESVAVAAQGHPGIRWHQPAIVQPAAQVAWWIQKAEQFCLAKKDGSRPFAKAWEPLYAKTVPPKDEK